MARETDRRALDDSLLSFSPPTAMVSPSPQSTRVNVSKGRFKEQRRPNLAAGEPEKPLRRGPLGSRARSKPRFPQ